MLQFFLRKKRWTDKQQPAGNAQLKDDLTSTILRFKHFHQWNKLAAQMCCDHSLPVYGFFCFITPNHMGACSSHSKGHSNATLNEEMRLQLSSWVTTFMLYSRLSSISQIQSWSHSKMICDCGFIYILVMKSHMFVSQTWSYKSDGFFVKYDSLSALSSILHQEM